MSTNVVFDEDLFNRMFDEMIAESDTRQKTKSKTKKEESYFEPLTKKTNHIKEKVQKSPSEISEEKRKKALAKKISRNTAKAIRKEERAERRKANKPKAFEREQRFTEHKERNLLSRIILQNRLAKEDFDYLEYNWETGYMTEEDIKSSKTATKRRDRKLYKEVQAYEDAVEDVTVRRGWATFKIGLATALLAGTLALAHHTGTEVAKSFNEMHSANQIVSIYEMNDEEKEQIYLNAVQIKSDVVQRDGYHFDNLSEAEFADGYIRMMKVEKKMNKQVFEGAFLSSTQNKDQDLLDKIVSKAFEEEYANFTDAQKRDYRQLAYELLPYSLPQHFKDGMYYVRNPLVIDALNARNSAKSKGYQIELRVNSDEKENLRNIGNIEHILNTMPETRYSSIGQTEEEQRAFFSGIIDEVMGENTSKLSKTQRKDYNQIIYELLSNDAKQHIVDPLEYEKDMFGRGIGDEK